MAEYGVHGVPYFDLVVNHTFPGFISVTTTGEPWNHGKSHQIAMSLGDLP